MKLIGDGETQHHLPEDPDKKQSGMVKSFNRLMGKVFSGNGITIMLGVFLFLLLSSIMSLGYFQTSRFVDDNGISLQDFYAEKTLDVVDVEETKRKKEWVRQNVPLIYVDPAPINQSVLESLDRRSLAISLLFDEKDTKNSAQLDKLEQFERLLEGSPKAKSTYKKLMKDPLTDKEWDELHTRAKGIAQKILTNKLNLTDYLENREAIIKQQIPRRYSQVEQDFIFMLLDQTLQPNQLLDEAAMEMARKRAEGKVEPVVKTFPQNKIIVRQGEEVTPLQKAALEKMGKSINSNHWFGVLGVLILTSIFTTTLWGYIRQFKEGEFFQPRYAALLVLLLSFTVLSFKFLQSFGDKIPLYIFPMGALTLIVTIFTHHRVGILTTTVTVFLLGMALKVDFMVLSVLFFGSLMGTYVLSRRINFKDRGHLMFAGVYVSLINALGIIAITLMDPTFNIVNQADWKILATNIGWGIGGGILSGMLTLGALPFLEMLFRLVSPYTLIELSNHDHPLLRRMQFEAPGTFHHSLMVASLAESAAEAVDANSLLTRVGCLYHDIGKMKRPLFFIENQAYFGSENPHDKLTPRLSKLVITAHPRDSLEMAKQYNLPQVVKDFMTEHHGTLTAGYFYNKAVLEEGEENVNKSQFRYAGPKPQTRETAIVMLADASESACRALKNPTVSQIEERIDKIIQQRVEDGQFDNCPITFRDIHIARETFVRVIRGIHHNRIEYQQNIMRDLGRKVGQKPAPKPEKPVDPDVDIPAQDG